jgi:hypothetical protein
MAAGSTMLAMTFFMNESYAPVLLARKAKKLRKQTGRDGLQSVLKIDLSPRDLLISSMIRPVKVCLSIYNSVSVD